MTALDPVPTPTFLWHDYETFGKVARRDRPAQFAAIRTDAELNEIGEPLMLYCQPANDYLPDPGACLITGITPQICLERGVPEHEFAARIEQEFSRAGTIGVGYNSIRFDDEVTRHLFWRNLIDPYGREWRNGCGRWDLLDLVRAAHALRPDGIVWPQRPDGAGTSFKLGDLAAANGLLHEAAHDALSDVRATIALARLIREKQPRLFDFCLALHKKERVAAELGLPTTVRDARPFLHVSGMFAPERGCLAVMLPLAMHPTNRNELIAWDLSHDPAELATLDAEAIRRRIFTRAEDLPEGEMRLAIKTVHLNKSPVVVSSMKALTPEQAERWQIDVVTAERHAEVARGLPDMRAVWAQVFAARDRTAVDVDEDLYGGFITDADRRRLDQMRTRAPVAPDALGKGHHSFDDPRLPELAWRWRARNFGATLSAEDAERWEQHRAARLFDAAGGARTVDALFAEIDALSETADERGEAILGALYDWAEQIAPER
ncbi:MAG: exodeoxyribonuclease I [Burkholderiales bacterium]